MTREEAIEYWEQFNAEIDDLYDAWSDAERDVLVKQREIVEYTISALRQQDVTDKDVGKWISVKDRLPEEKQRVLVRCKTVGTTVGWRLWGEWMTDLGDGGSEVAYWMPMPEPPEDRANG